MKNFLKFCVAVISSRWKIFVVLNFVFFTCIALTLAIATLLLPPRFYSRQLPTPSETPIPTKDGVTLFATIFVIALVFSSFILKTLLGLAFFPLATASLLYTGVIFGLLVYPLTTWQFLIIFPTLVLEGEAYVLAATAGTIWGASWLIPVWLYPKQDVRRTEAFKAASKECLRIYILVISFLLVSATVETVTILLIS